MAAISSNTQSSQSKIYEYIHNIYKIISEYKKWQQQNAFTARERKIFQGLLWERAMQVNFVKFGNFL